MPGIAGPVTGDQGDPGKPAQHRRSVRIAARVLIGTLGPMLLLFLALLIEPLEPGESAAAYYAAMALAGVFFVAVYEAASHSLTLVLSRVFGRVPVRTHPPTRPSLLTVRGGALTAGAYFGGLIATAAIGGITLGILAALDGDTVAISTADLAWIMPLGMVVGAIACVATVRRKATRRDLVAIRRWNRVPGRTTILLTVVAAVFVAAVATLVLPVVVPISDDFEPGVLAKMSDQQGFPRVMLALIAVVLAPPLEEFVFRGVLLEGVLRRSGRFAAVVVTAVLFAAVHVPDMWGYWPGILTILLGGTLLAALRLRTGSLVAPVIGHASYNAALVVLAAIMSW